MVVGGLLRSAAMFLSLFRVDVTLRYKDLSIDDLALVAAVAGHLSSLQQPVTVYHPALFPPGLAAGGSVIRGRLQALAEFREDTSKLLLDLKRFGEQLKAQIEALNSDIIAGDANDPKVDTRPIQRSRAAKQFILDQLTDTCTRLESAGSSFDSFQSALLKDDETSRINALERVLRAEKLQEVAGNAHWLLLKIAAAAGGYKTKRWLWWPTTKILYSGGVIVEFVLFDPAGKIVTAGILPGYSRFFLVRDRSEPTTDLGAAAI